MRALVFTAYGDPSVMSLTEVPAPVPAAGEVLIRVTAAGLNPVDALQREGTFKAIDPYRFPKVAGNELSGVIEALGAGVTGFEVGQSVIARVGKSELGAIAQLATTSAAHVAAAPTSIPLADAAGLPLAGLTAQQALGPDHLGVRAGERLLITGAAGGVGQIAVQLAVALGAEVTVTASPEGAEILRGLGAAHVIDYRERTVSEGPERFDKVLDLVGGDTVSDALHALEPGGALVTISGPPSPGSLTVIAAPSRRWLAAIVERAASRRIRRTARALGVSYEFFLMHPDGAGLADLVREVDAGRLSVPIDSRFPLEEYRAAFERLESRRSKGKVALQS